MVAGIVVLAGAKIYVYNLPLIVGSFLAIGGLLWGLLLVLNNDKVEKRTNIVTAQTVSEHFAVSYIFSNYSAPHSQNRSFRAIIFAHVVLRQRNFQNYAHSCKHDSQNL